jgi:hypothetical protein
MIVGSLLAQPQAAAAGRYTGPAASPIYPYPIPLPTKLPKPRLGGTDCTGVEQCATAPIAPIAPPGSQPSEPRTLCVPAAGIGFAC